MYIYMVSQKKDRTIAQTLWFPGIQYHEDVLKLAMGSVQRVTRSYSVHGTDPVNSDYSTIAQKERKDIIVQFGDLLTITKPQLYDHRRVKGGAYSKCELGLEHHFEAILRTLPRKKTHLGDIQRPILRLRGVPKNVSSILVWSPLKSSLEGWCHIQYFTQMNASYLLSLNLLVGW